uniref:Uncharacterized protein n=1 Tax=Aegilops tauschii subsp. strangulata TaxID=200361 RepID=A0A453AT88_AEGTS
RKPLPPVPAEHVTTANETPPRHLAATTINLPVLPTPSPASRHHAAAAGARTPTSPTAARPLPTSPNPRPSSHGRPPQARGGGS